MGHRERLRSPRKGFERHRQQKEETRGSVAPWGSLEGQECKSRSFVLSQALLTSLQVPNDGLSLRQPVYNTSFTYLQPSASASQQHLLAGTHYGHVRRYDTRAARRPVADWKGIGKVGGIRTVEKGLVEQ